MLLAGNVQCYRRRGHTPLAWNCTELRRHLDQTRPASLDVDTSRGSNPHAKTVSRDMSPRQQMSHIDLRPEDGRVLEGTPYLVSRMGNRRIYGKH
jgi:hypothetical protein